MRSLAKRGAVWGAVLGFGAVVYGETDFVHEVMPILSEHCADCHTGEKKKGGLSMNTREELLAGGENGEVVVLGDGHASLMIELTASKYDDEWMPPKGDRVPPEKIAILKKWIDEGMPWEPGIRLGDSAWEPPLYPREVELPAAQEGRAHPIDRILDADVFARGKSIPEPASDAEFLRRATLDIIGLLPTPEELDAFLADSSPDKRSLLIDQLLTNDIGYADHWLTTWNDLLRNDYTGTGFITKGRKGITGWLYDALKQNKPYNQFVTELIAPTEASAGFIEGIKWRGKVNASQTPEIQFAQNISQVFLGINMKCASCHDSFIDRWKLSEAYNLAAITATVPLELNRCDKPTGVMAKAAWIFPELGDIDPNAEREVRLQQLASLMTHPENGRFTRTIVNRLWERLMGRGIVHPVDAMDTQPWSEDLLDFLAGQFVEEEYDLRGFIKFVMTSEAYQSRSVLLEKEPGEDYVYAGPITRRMSAEQFMDTIWQVTDTAPGKSDAGVPRFQPSNEDLGYPIAAKWIWHAGEKGTKSELRKVFSIGGAPDKAILQATCDNAFVMKVNGKQVAESQDWQAPVEIDIASFLQAGETSSRWKRRCSGGACGFIGQVAMYFGDGDPVVMPSDATWQARPPGAAAEWASANVIANHGAGAWGNILRSGKSFPVRASLVKNDFLMRSLGRPNRDQVVTSRPAGLTTLQAIDLANGDILAGYLSKGAAKLLANDQDPMAIAERVFEHGLSRSPNDGEREVLQEIVQTTPNPQLVVEDLLWLVFMQPDFQLIR